MAVLSFQTLNFVGGFSWKNLGNCVLDSHYSHRNNEGAENKSVSFITILFLVRCVKIRLIWSSISLFCLKILTEARR